MLLTPFYRKGRWDPMRFSGCLSFSSGLGNKHGVLFRNTAHCLAGWVLDENGMP